MNEILFFTHILFIAIFTLGALRLGKEALYGLVVLQVILANLFVLKQITLFGLNVTCSDVFSVGTLWCLNLLNEYYGKDEARKAVWISFSAMVFFAVMSKIHLLYIPSILDISQNHFTSILSHAPRILMASMFAYFVSGHVDVFIYASVKNVFGRFIFLRSGISMAIAQVVDTVLFSYLGLYGIISTVNSVILMSLIIKCISILSTVPFTTFSQKAFHVRK